MPRKKFECAPGHEVRGFMIRLYPDHETEEKLIDLQGQYRRAWNQLVAFRERTLEARYAYADRMGLVGPMPSRPDYAAISSNDERRAASESYGVKIGNWCKAACDATSDVDGCRPPTLKELMVHFRARTDAELMRRLASWNEPDCGVKLRSGVHEFRSVTQNFFAKRVAGNGRKKHRRTSDPMPIQTRSGHHLRLGAFGTRRGQPFYNCQISFNGLKIRGRLPGMVPSGRVLEGVSIVKQADGWWASIKQEVPVRNVPPAEPGTVIGIDVGLDNLAAMSDGRRLENIRGKAYSERIAGRQARKLPTGRLEQAAARHVRHEIYNKIIKPLATIETIKVERLPKHIGQIGSVKKSSMRTIVALLRERYGDRVREVEPYFTSQDCSQCGHRSKESWSYEHGRIGQCPACGYRADRDVNAARNIAAKSPILLEPRET